MIYCPNCGSGDGHENNRIDEQPFIDAAREASALRYYGDTETAVNALERLSKVQIQNFARFEWRCGSCGSQFDGY